MCLQMTTLQVQMKLMVLAVNETSVILIPSIGDLAV